MKILIKSARITDIESPHHLTSKDILIADGIIVNIATSITEPDAVQISAPALHVSQGWVDFKAAFYDPGNEERGGISKGLDDAALGGFTHVGVLPTNIPTTDNKTGVDYKMAAANGHCVQLHPIGAITKDQQGKSLAELYEMFQSGAKWFCDDQHPISSGILTRALLYTRDFKGKIIFIPRSNDFVKDAMVNEGLASTKTGLKGHPYIDERIELQKALEIVRYTNAPLHVSGISSLESLYLIKDAKQSGLPVTCDVHYMNLCFNENEVLNFDSRYKVLPVLRTEHDRKALVSALENGIIDGIVSDHRPFVSDDKQVAFDEAQFGAPQLTSGYSALLQYAGLGHDKIIEVLSNKNRALFGIESRPIQVGNKADITCYSPEELWQLDDRLTERSCNPLSGKTLKGRSLAIIHQGIAMLNIPENV
jgi:dihydroorotase